MNEVPNLCTKNVHFIFNGEIYIQIDGVARDSPLGPVLANIFMVELEKMKTAQRSKVMETLCYALLKWIH